MLRGSSNRHVAAADTPTPLHHVALRTGALICATSTKAGGSADSWMLNIHPIGFIVLSLSGGASGAGIPSQEHKSNSGVSGVVTDGMQYCLRPWLAGPSVTHMEG
jgi:hypothetical protein